jgi:hypothetical protein
MIDKLNRKCDRDDRGNYSTYQKNKKFFTCHKCDQPGHFRADCRKNKRRSIMRRSKTDDNSKNNPSLRGRYT